MGSRLTFLIMLWAGLSLQAQPVSCDLAGSGWPSSADPHYRSFLDALDERPSLGWRSDVTIPVVIHVVARAGSLPVTQAQVLHQLDVLNADFAGRGEHVNSVPDIFRSSIANTGIRFCLAASDPLGNPSTGITYTITDQSNIALLTGPEGRRVLFYEALGGADGWDPDRYLNIWVAEYGDFLGSASFPGMAPFPQETGIVINIRNFGSIGEAGSTVFFDRGHTLAHEAGHYFGLRHIWGDGLGDSCDDSDDIDDTPNASGPYYGCPSGIQSSCGSEDMYMNFMDFTDDRCLSFFTKDQATRMRAVLDLAYPQLGTTEDCRPLAMDPETWWAGLTWSWDRHAGKYIVFHPAWDTTDKLVEVFSMDGRRVLRTAWGRGSTHLLDLSRVAAGLYVARITAGTHRYTRTLISIGP